MSLCEYLQNQRDWCISQAISVKDGNMKTFFTNAAEGFQRRLESMTIGQLEQQII